MWPPPTVAATWSRTSRNPIGRRRPGRNGRGLPAPAPGRTGCHQPGTLKLNYPDHPSLVDGQFQPKQEEADNRSWLSKATLGLIETETPLPPGETRANQDVVKQFQDARSEMPEELLPKDEDGNPILPEGPKEAEKDRSWFSYMTLVCSTDITRNRREAQGLPFLLAAP